VASPPIFLEASRVSASCLLLLQSPPLHGSLSPPPGGLDRVSQRILHSDECPFHRVLESQEVAAVGKSYDLSLLLFSVACFFLGFPCTRTVLYSGPTGNSTGHLDFNTPSCIPPTAEAMGCQKWSLSLEAHIFSSHFFLPFRCIEPFARKSL